jgi:hypothetical protein
VQWPDAPGWWWLTVEPSAPNRPRLVYAVEHGATLIVTEVDGARAYAPDCGIDMHFDRVDEGRRVPPWEWVVESVQAD